jgi:hypothetical protein
MTNILLYEFFNDISQEWERDWIMGEMDTIMKVFNKKGCATRKPQFFDGEFMDVETRTEINQPKKKVK